MKKLWKLISFDHLMVSLLTVLTGGLLTLVSINLTIFNPMKRAFQDFSMVDVYNEIMRGNGAVELNDEITLVDMTDLYDRSAIASLIKEVSECNPKVLVIDLIFERPGFDENENAYLKNTLDSIPNSIIACKLTDYDDEKKMFRHNISSFFYEPESATKLGFSNVVSGDGFNTIRKFTYQQMYQGHTVYSLSYMAASMAQGVKPTPQLHNERSISYSETDFPVVGHNDVAVNRKLIENRIVFIGTMNEEADMHITPHGKMPGMKIQAYTTLSILNQKDLIDAPILWSILLMVVVCYLSAFAGVWIDRKFNLSKLYWLKFYYFVVAAVIGWIGFYCYSRFNYNFSLVYPLLGLALVETGRLEYKWIIIVLSKKKVNIVKKSVYYVPVD